MIPLSTRSRIILLVILAGLPALALTVYSTWDERARLELHARSNLQQLATNAAQRQEQIIEGARQTLVAISLALAGTQDDQAQCNAYLAKLLAQSTGIYHSMGIYRADGVLICNAIPWQGNIVSTDRLYLRIPMKTGKFAVGEYQVGRVTKLQGINVGYPIKDSAGSVAAVAFVAIDLDALNRMSAATPLLDKELIIVIDRDGVILARTPERTGRVGTRLSLPHAMETVLSGKSGIFQMNDVDGIERLWAYETVIDNPDGVIPLRVLVSIPMTVIFAEANRAFVRNLIGIALATLLLLIAAWYGTEIFIHRKVRALLSAAGRVHAGELGTRTGMSRNDEELGQIGAAFDEMTQALQDRDTELQKVLLKLNEQVTTDPLTGLHNRRYLQDFLRREFDRARRGATPVAAIMLDIDYFKRINDTFGHAAGDLVLKELALLLEQHIRGSDMVCRYGGEEFLLILPGATLEGARQRAENIRNLVQGLDLRYHDQPLGTITASLGVALFPIHAADTDALIQAADGALYESKAAGRNRVSVSTKSQLPAAVAEIT